MGFSQQFLEPFELQAERKVRTDVLMGSLTVVMLVLRTLLKWVLGNVKIIRCLSCPPAAGSRQDLLVPSGYLCPFDLNGNTLYFWWSTYVKRVNSHCKIFWRKALLPQENNMDMEGKPWQAFLYMAELCLSSRGGQLFILLLAPCLRLAADVQLPCPSGARWVWARRTAAAGIICVAFTEPCRTRDSVSYGLPYRVFISVTWLLCVVWIHKAVICITSTLWALMFVGI